MASFAFWGKIVWTANSIQILLVLELHNLEQTRTNMFITEQQDRRNLRKYSSSCLVLIYTTSKNMIYMETGQFYKILSDLNWVCYIYLLHNKVEVTLWVKYVFGRLGCHSGCHPMYYMYTQKAYEWDQQVQGGLLWLCCWLSWRFWVPGVACWAPSSRLSAIFSQITSTSLN